MKWEMWNPCDQVTRSFVMRGRCFWIQILLVPAVVMAREFFVVGPSKPTMITAGEDVVLECQMLPVASLDALEVRWFRSSPDSIVHLYTNGHDQPGVPDEAYHGRTELFQEEFPRGNASLLLKRTKVSDAGSYTCSIESSSHREQAVMLLQVAAFGIQPWIHLEENNKQSLRVVCQSDGWFPHPRVWWIDGSGQDVTALSNTRFTESSRKLITVHSHINVTSDSVNKYSCFFRSGLLGKTREAHLQISDDFFIKVDAWLVVFWVLASLVVTAAAFNVMIHRKEDKVIKELQLFCSLEGYDEVDIGFVSVTLDVDTANPWLEVSEDRKRMRRIRTWREGLPDTGKRFTGRACALGSEGFTSGRHYWEVEVSGNRGWCLGVAAESVERKGLTVLIPDTGVWSIWRVGDEFYVKTSPPSDLPAGSIPGTVGIYLSYESGSVSFFCADTKSRLHSFTGNKFTGKLYPFFWTWDVNKWLRICSSPL
ncbi:butyrophilin subfamily 1 member A1-like isoform X2 [Narcine bancroftii]|uniref:butyrophilin subfamily 1 member A1-like isoform X2 n=1 Tax=Narcine bancroftii TaxID=1343680 RepID=UPI00383146C1